MTVKQSSIIHSHTVKALEIREQKNEASAAWSSLYTINYNSTDCESKGSRNLPTHSAACVFK